RDYVWSIGVNGGTAPAGGQAAETPPPVRADSGSRGSRSSAGSAGAPQLPALGGGALASRLHLRPLGRKLASLRRRRGALPLAHAGRGSGNGKRETGNE